MPILDKEYVRDDGRLVRVFKLTPDEIAQSDAVLQYEKDLAVCFENRRVAYEAKGWYNEFDIIDDAARRGWETVNAERLAIKQQFPKPVDPRV